MLATAATIGGTVERSVIGRGAVVEEGAVVRDSVVLPGAVVRAGATVERAILDDLVHVERDVTVGGAGGEIALVGAAGDRGAGRARRRPLPGRRRRVSVPEVLALLALEPALGA